MEFPEFVAFHTPALGRNEIKYSLLLDNLSPTIPYRYINWWSLGEPGACAVMVKVPSGANWSIILGDIDEFEAHKLAEHTVGFEYPGVIGSDLTAHWFAARAVQLGVVFDEVEPQQIYMLDDPPVHPRVEGYARPLGVGDTVQFLAWLRLFTEESSPHDPVPTLEDASRLIAGHQFFFWIDDNKIVSMAGICRRQKHTAAITGVYTPPDYRGHGYAAAITAAMVEYIHLENRTAILYTDLRHPAPNRCYIKLGFRPIYPSWHFHRYTHLDNNVY
jgi:RimJ/RimL family protein N-acetyltransferase